MRVDVQVVDAYVIRPLRHAVLRTGMPIETAAFDSDDAPTTLHLAAYNGERVVGCVSVMAKVCPDVGAWQLRGMAVDPACRGHGVGAALIAEVHRRMAGQQLWCNARLPAVRFYEQHGWRCVTDVFDVPTAGPHRRMIGPASSEAI